MSLRQNARRQIIRASPNLVHSNKTLSLVLDAKAEDVYAFLAKPENLAHWAPNFCESIARVEGQWLVQTTSGPLTFCFTTPETFGVLDHRLTLDSGEEIFVAMRVTAQAALSKISITIPRDPLVSDAQFEQDLQRVEQDLYTLKCIVECLAALQPAW